MGPLLSRGVYRAPYLVKGLPALVAVDRFGVARKHLAVPPGASWERCVAWMEQKLELWDPAPQLALVNPQKQRDHMTREIPARMYRDPHDIRAYRRMLAKNAANRMPGRGPTLG
jgi:hypothetical protein